MSQALAELYLTLSRAFLAPDNEEAWVAMRDALADDLDELGVVLGHDIAGPVAGYRGSIAAIPDQASLLQIYSALFLAPPRPVVINTGAYLDGVVNGGSVLAMEEEYRRWGVERNDGFKDLSDHVSIQLEFIAHLYGCGATAKDVSEDRPDAAAEEFLQSYVARWLPPFLRDLESQHERLDGLDNPWRHLARVLRVLVPLDAGRGEPHGHARGEITAADIAVIARKLREQGLTTDHLPLPPGQSEDGQRFPTPGTASPYRGFRPAG